MGEFKESSSITINKYSRLSDYYEDTFRQYSNVIESRCVVLNVVFTDKLAEAKANQISRPKWVSSVDVGGSAPSSHLWVSIRCISLIC